MIYCTGMALGWSILSRKKKRARRGLLCTEEASRLCPSPFGGSAVFTVHLNDENCSIIRTTILEHQVWWKWESNRKTLLLLLHSSCVLGDWGWQLPGHSALASILARACDNLIGIWFNCVMLGFYAAFSFLCCASHILLLSIHSMFLLDYECFQNYAQEPQALFIAAFH